jgi:hypothetical protein
MDTEKLSKMVEMVEVQGQEGNWNYDPYMHGMYNGMELMLAMVEGREPAYKEAPTVWLADMPKSEDPPIADYHPNLV